MKGKWVIELDGSKIKSWDNFYYQIMSQIDFYEYDKKFEISWYTMKAAVEEFEIIERYLQNNSYNEIIILYKEPNFEMNDFERGYIYLTITTLFLEMWNNIISKTTCYIITERLKKLKFPNNKLEIITLEEKAAVLKENKKEEVLEINAKKIRKFEDLLEILSNNIEKLQKKYTIIIIDTFMEILYYIDYNESNLIFNTFIERLLLEKGNREEEIKIYGIVN